MRGCSTLLIAIPFALAAAAGVQAAPAAWKTTGDRGGKCQVQVPGAWVPGEYNLGMQAPGGGGTLLISATQMDSLAMAKQIVATTFTVQKTIEDTPNRYWMAYADNSGRPGTRWYVAVKAGAGYVCAIQLEFDAKLSDADAKTIVNSLAKH